MQSTIALPYWPYKFAVFVTCYAIRRRNSFEGKMAPLSAPFPIDLEAKFVDELSQISKSCKISVKDFERVQQLLT